KVMIVVAVLITSCHVSLNLNNGPLSANMSTSVMASKKVKGMLATFETACANVLSQSLCGIGDFRDLPFDFLSGLFLRREDAEGIGLSFRQGTPADGHRSTGGLRRITKISCRFTQSAPAPVFAPPELVYNSGAWSTPSTRPS